MCYPQKTVLKINFNMELLYIDIIIYSVINSPKPIGIQFIKVVVKNDLVSRPIIFNEKKLYIFC